jgi:hypothetical protein
MGTFTVYTENQKELDEYIMKKWHDNQLKYRGWAAAEGVVEVKEGQIIEGDEAVKMQEAAAKGPAQIQETERNQE